jgi:hypothetical protein
MGPDALIDGVWTVVFVIIVVVVVVTVEEDEVKVDPGCVDELDDDDDSACEPGMGSLMSLSMSSCSSCTPRPL